MLEGGGGRAGQQLMGRRSAPPWLESPWSSACHLGQMSLLDPGPLAEHESSVVPGLGVTARTVMGTASPERKGSRRRPAWGQPNLASSRCLGSFLLRACPQCHLRQLLLLTLHVGWE